MVVRIATMVLRITALLALILGIIFWATDSADSLVPVHMILGILVVLSLWTAGIVAAVSRRGSWGLAGAAVVLGAIVLVVGLTQRTLLPNPHWVIQVTHLLLGLLAIGLGEMIAARYKRRAAMVSAR
ncbi:MAG: hypothetical protein M3Z08_17565 [Chloroflexota bacterium]|nr:hypothetical protein [Chloroflexota bacterium]